MEEKLTFSFYGLKVTASHHDPLFLLLAGSLGLCVIASIILLTTEIKKKKTENKSSNKSTD